MLALSSSCRYFLYRKGTDMRCGIYSLAALVSNELRQDPLNGDVFIFIGKRSNRAADRQIRLLQWDRDGYAMYCKRLEQGTFQWPNGYHTPDHIIAQLVIAGAFTLYSYSIYCGYLLIQKQTKGILLTQINYALQILHVTVVGVTCEYTCAFGFWVGFDLTQEITLLLYSSFSGFLFKYSPTSDVFKIQFNLVAIGLIVFLEKLKQKELLVSKSNE